MVSLPKVGEGACGDDSFTELVNVLGGEDIELRSVGFPFWADRQVLCHVLMAEKEVGVSPVRSGHLGGCNKISNVVLLAAQFLGSIHTVNLVKS